MKPQTCSTLLHTMCFSACSNVRANFPLQVWALERNICGTLWGCSQPPECQRPNSGENCLCRYGPCEAADLQHRMKRAVALLGPQEVKTILETEGKIEVTCGFCKETYQFSEEDVMKVNTQL